MTHYPSGFGALLNAREAIAEEDWLRRWPMHDQTSSMDEIAAQLGARLRGAPQHVREENFSRIWWERFRREPVIADLVRVGVSFDEAEERMTKRLARFSRAFYG